MKARGRFMSREELRNNAVSYLKQASKIVRFEGDNPIEIRYNGDWLTKLKLEDLLGIAEHFTVQQMIERDMYQVRLKANEPINLREFMYPLLQGYDSVAMNVDLEQGGSDQTFNMLAGRTLVKAMLGKEKFVMTVPLLTDSKGVKIGKTEGNVIGLTDPPNELYGKIMSLGDDAIIPCFTLLTDIPLADIDSMNATITAGTNPMDLKKRLAHELTKMLNSEKDADTAQKEFESRFQNGDVATADLPVVSLSALPVTGTVISYVVALGLVKSNSDARRLIGQHGVRLNSVVLSNPKDELHLQADDVVEVGRKAVKIGK
jgi:tyrosyl-tRNA synthetase